MSPLWGNRQDDNGDEEGRNADQHPAGNNADGRENNADERTRLLPREGQGFLSPDDPAVSTWTFYISVTSLMLAVIARYRLITYGASEYFEIYLSSS